jgi:glucokinase
MLRYPLRQKLRDALGCPVSLGNDTNCAALGEKHYGMGQHCDDMLYIAVGTGIGAGIIVGGELFAGSHGFAGEIGHMVVTDGLAQCVCGNRGCLEAVASAPAIARAAWDRLCAGESSILHEIAGGSREACSAQAVLRAADQGDQLALGVVSTAGRMIGRAVAALVNAIDIDTVILSIPLEGTGGLLVRTAAETALQLVTAVHRPLLKVMQGSLGERASSIGAAVLALQNIFTPGGIDQYLMAEEAGGSS